MGSPPTLIQNPRAAHPNPWTANFCLLPTQAQGLRTNAHGLPIFAHLDTVSAMRRRKALRIALHCAEVQSLCIVWPCAEVEKL